MQLGLIALAFGWGGSIAPSLQKWCELAAAGLTLALGTLLLVQLPRALQWRPRRDPRPSAEIIAERRRIAHDLHDNVGSQLVCALGLLDPSNDHEREVLVALDKCMLDLRLIVDSMDDADASFEDRMAQLRYRIEPVLDRRGVRLFWDVHLHQHPTFAHADSARHLVAIVQEALSNALQHARATEIKVSATSVDGSQAWCVEVSDNGRGIEYGQGGEGSPPKGYGATGMARRARLAGGKLLIQSSPAGGTCIRAVVPCTSAPRGDH